MWSLHIPTTIVALPNQTSCASWMIAPKHSLERDCTPRYLQLYTSNATGLRHDMASYGGVEVGHSYLVDRLIQAETYPFLDLLGRRCFLAFTPSM